MNKKQHIPEKEVHAYHQMFAHSSPEISARIQERLKAEIAQDRRKKVRIRNLKRISAAAAVVLICSISLYIYRPLPDQDVLLVEVPITDLQPGTHRATLQLADGRTIHLKPDQHEVISYGNQLKYAGGELIEAATYPSEALISVSTPRGGKYRVILPDGTRVWLNAETTLTYPLQFAADHRTVSLTGEAFFDVTHQGQDDHVPFILLTENQDIKVLGTQFNVSAYIDDSFTQTTLIQGSVQVSTKEQGFMTLRPNEQAVSYPNGNTVIQSVDTRLFSSWKEDVFKFEETELRQVMNQLGRWYDFQVRYDGMIPDTYFYGEIRMDKSLNAALSIMRASGLNFKLLKNDKKNELIIMP